MEILTSIQTIVPVIMMIITIFNMKIALSIYLVYMVCVPYYNIYLFGLRFGYNLLHFFFLFVFIFIYNKGKKISIRQLTPYLFFYLATFVMILFQDRITFAEQFERWRIDMMLTLTVPFIIFNTQSDKCLSKFFKIGLYVAMLIAGLYAIYLMTLPNGLNPYLMYMSYLNGVEYKIDYAAGLHRVMPRIFSTFSHPLSWCLFISFFLITFWNYINNTNKILFYAIMVLSVFNLVFCGVRTGMFALSIPIAYLIYKNFHKKILIYALFFLIVSYLIVDNVPILQDLIYSAFDNSQTTTQGSSLDLRLRQWEGCVEECYGRELIGNGFRWTDYYMEKNETHPKALCFESLIFVIYTNWGIIGFIIWGFFFIMLLRVFNYSFKDKSFVSRMNALLILYVVFSILTGEYHYMRWFALFHAILYTHLKQLDYGNTLKSSLYKTYESQYHCILSATIPSFSRK